MVSVIDKLTRMNGMTVLADGSDIELRLFDPRTARSGSGTLPWPHRRES
jgi:hypothetical protein